MGGQAALLCQAGTRIASIGLVDRHLLWSALVNKLINPDRKGGSVDCGAEPSVGTPAPEDSVRVPSAQRSGAAPDGIERRAELEPLDVGVAEPDNPSLSQLLEPLDNVDVIELLVLDDAVIDYVIIGPTGVFVVDDPAAVGGEIELRDVQRLWRTELRCFVDGQDRSHLTAALPDRVTAVRDALGDEFSDVAVRGVLCPTGCVAAESERPRWVGDVLVSWPSQLVAAVSRDQSPNTLDETRRREISARLQG